MKSVPTTSGVLNEDPFECAQISSCSCHGLEGMGLDQALRELSKASLAPEFAQLLLHRCLLYQNSKTTLQANCNIPLCQNQSFVNYLRGQSISMHLFSSPLASHNLCVTLQLLLWHQWQKKKKILFLCSLHVSHKPRL